MTRPSDPSPQWGDDARAAAILGMLRAVRAFGDAHDRMAGDLKHGMHMNASDVAALRLLIIREEQGRTVSPHEIARHLRISTASTTKLLDRLTESGHVRRVPHPQDRRARVVALTEAARVDFFRLYGPKLAAIREALAPFDDAELDAAMRVMNAVGSALDPGDVG
ncbi:MarR family transcriptional regulator [Leucobacter ruminantium]|uniref:MarR family transcriptional regulator n=1 Tax=Leucobacter ruminantium TaxID=1289170 RepID=A0A939LXS2_9MICO|nr:MarR family transcriptional regulator [Leucobacter ruminantium]MBO1805098.1 MarR family transcriptional regulator [Leucobacter ruminantium]